MCEFDKYCRCLNGEGSVTVYKPRGEAKGLSNQSPPPMKLLSQEQVREMSKLRQSILAALVSAVNHEVEDDEGEDEDDIEEDVNGDD